MRRLPTLSRLSIVGVLGALTLVSQGDELQNPDGTVTTVITAPPLSFSPFVLADLVNSDTGRPYGPEDLVEIRVDGRLHFQGHAQDLLGVLNDSERYFTGLGQTLRKDGALDLFKILANKDGALNAQLASALKLRFEVVRDEIREALADCDLLTIDKLGINLKTRLPFRPEDKVALEGEISLAAGELVERFNEQQKLLCSIGASMFENMEAMGDDVVSGLLSRRGTLMAKLGISKFHPAFSMQSIGKLKNYAEIGAEVADILRAREMPSAARIFELGRRVNVALPEELRLPEIPNIPSPNLKRRLDLKLEKRKVWPGVNYGDRKTFNVYADAWAELRGSETEQWAGAQGKGGFWVFGREMNVLTGISHLHAAPTGVDGSLLLTVVGQNLVDKKFTEALAWTYADPRALGTTVLYDFEKTFMVGPVPVSVTLGAQGDVYLGWNVGLTTLSIAGGVTPGLNINGFAKGGVGKGKFLSVGAKGTLLLIKDEIPVEANAAVRFDEAGVPYLKMALNAENHSETLKGGIGAYAEYPAPRWGLPPWKIKEATFEIYKWNGFRGSQKIMNWGIELSPFGAHLSGDLADQSDRAEAQGLQSAILIEERRAAVTKLEQDATEKEVRLFGAVSGDLMGANNANLEGEAVALRGASETMNESRLQFLKNLGENL